jgi:hypothetical protein
MELTKKTHSGESRQVPPAKGKIAVFMEKSWGTFQTLKRGDVCVCVNVFALCMCACVLEMVVYVCMCA